MHVGQHEIGLPPIQRGADAVGRIGIGHVERELVTPAIGSISTRSTAITRPFPAISLDALRRDLAPAAGRRAEIDHGHARA